MKRSKDRHLIHIGPDFAFEIDRRCFTLLKRRITEKGEAHFDTIGYYTSLEAMYFRLVDVGIDGMKNLQDIAERQIDLKKWVGQSLEDARNIPSRIADWHKSKFRIPRQGYD